MPTTIVEIHIPLTPAPGLAGSDYQFPWIDDVEEFLEDDGEEYGDVYVFFLSDGPEEALLRKASQVAALARVPEGVVAFVSDDDAEEWGLGRRVTLPV